MAVSDTAEGALRPSATGRSKVDPPTVVPVNVSCVPVGVGVGVVVFAWSPKACPVTAPSAVTVTAYAPLVGNVCVYPVDTTCRSA